MIADNGNLSICHSGIPQGESNAIKANITTRMIKFTKGRDSQEICTIKKKNHA